MYPKNPTFYFYHDIPEADQARSAEDLEFMPLVYVKMHPTPTFLQVMVYTDPGNADT